MASPEAWIRATIEAESSVDAYPMVVPEGTVPPFIIYSRSSTTRERAMDGTLGGPAGQFAIEIYCDSYSAGKEIVFLLHSPPPHTFLRVDSCLSRRDYFEEGRIAA